MNLTNFLKQVDELSAQCSVRQLMAFVHETARVLPESGREDFLKRLRLAGEGQISAQGQKEDSELRRAYQKIRDNLKRIDSQEIAITSILNEAYDDWYNSAVDEFFYEDKEGIGDMLAEACKFVHICMDAEMYQEGFEIGKQLFSMEISCDSEYESIDFSIRDMECYHLLRCDLDETALDALYCAYHAAPLKKRPESFYGIIANAKSSRLTLEAVMQHGDEELPELQKFLPEWIAYLGEKAGDTADRLLPEAVGLLGDISSACMYAEKYSAIHPGIYLYILDHGNAEKIGTMISVGQQAMEKIPKRYAARSMAALKTADYMLQAGVRGGGLEKCYLAAYESDTTAVNYLRALLHGYGAQDKRIRLSSVLKTFPAKTGGSFWGTGGRGSAFMERQENHPDGNMVWTLCFLDGQFKKTLDDGLSVRAALGWSGTFMKQGIALFLLYLYKGEWHRQGIAEMAAKVKSALGFSGEAYQKGLPKEPDTEEGELFYQVFTKWKSMTVMEPDIEEKALGKIEKLLETRTEGIMSANRRNYYGECAAYIAALGEVRESRGEYDAKQSLMTSYKNMYSRRNAFRAEMKRFGWLG